VIVLLRHETVEDEGKGEAMIGREGVRVDSDWKNNVVRVLFRVIWNVRKQSQKPWLQGHSKSHGKSFTERVLFPTLSLTTLVMSAPKLIT
jgi:hypothetical protein